MRTARRRARPAAATLFVALSFPLLAACTQISVQPQAEGAAPGAVGGLEPPKDVPEPQSLAVDSARKSTGTVAAGGADAVYNYGPTVMVDGSRTRMWWCSQYGSAAPAGDDILHAEATGTTEPQDMTFTGPGGGAPPAVFSGKPGSFDGVHTCDPSVVRVDGTYYLYYTGSAGDRAHGNSIGLATSTDGLIWERIGSGPILSPAHDVARDNDYGAGQPAVVYLDGWFYLMFTDTSGAAAGWNGAGQFLLRSTDPAFAERVEALGPDGFAPVDGTDDRRHRSVVDAFSADLMFVDALDAFAIAHETEQGTTITFWNRRFTANPYHQVVIPGPWQEGPGLFRRPDGHAPLSTRDPCGRVPLDVVRATVIGDADAPTDLRQFGMDLHGLDGCADAARAIAVLDGVAMPSPVRTMDLVVSGRIVRVERRSVATELAATVLDSRVPAIEGVPVTARLAPGAPALRAEGTGLGMLLDDGSLWPVDGAEAPTVPELNGSTVERISESEWNSYPAGVVLGD